MSKKLLAIAAVLACGTTAQATKTGMYVGVKGGVLNHSTNQDVSTSNGGAQFAKYSQRKGSNDGTGGIFLGYARKFGMFFGGVDLDYMFASGKSKESYRSETAADAYDDTIHLKSAFGAAAVLGVSTTEHSVAFVRLGLEVRKNEWDRRLPNSTITTIEEMADKVSKTSTAFTPGIGVRIALNKKVDFHLQHVCALHSSASKKKTSGANTQTLSFKPTIHTTTVGFSYNF